MRPYWERKINRKLEPFYEFLAPGAPVFYVIAVGFVGIFILASTVYLSYILPSWMEEPPELRTYVSDKYGFSFKYSEEFEVGEMDLDGNGWIFVTPVLQTGEDKQAIVISARLNDPPISAVDWLYGPYSGYDASQGHMARWVGGQYAASVEEGSWVVFNSPDDEERVSVVLLGKDGPVPLQGEMEDILLYFSFDITLDPANLQCPSYYLTQSMKEQSLTTFVGTLPTTTDEIGLVPARIDFHISHNCIDMLEYYGYDGHEPITASVRQRLIDTTVERVKAAPQ